MGGQFEPKSQVEKALMKKEDGCMKSKFRVGFKF